jgi:hypothetical protein
VSRSFLRHTGRDADEAWRDDKEPRHFRNGILRPMGRYRSAVIRRCRPRPTDLACQIARPPLPQGESGSGPSRPSCLFAYDGFRSKQTRGPWAAPIRSVLVGSKAAGPHGQPLLGAHPYTHPVAVSPPVCGRPPEFWQAFQTVHTRGFQAAARDWILRLVCFDFRYAGAPTRFGELR